MVGSEKVENAVGIPQKHAVYDVNRELIKRKEDIVHYDAEGEKGGREMFGLWSCQTVARKFGGLPMLRERGGEECLIEIIPREM